jgi:uncharacterized protein (TIGR02145 family)
MTPTISDNKTTDGAGAGSFTSDITGLGGNIQYNVRAYATNSSGTGYGTTISFITNDSTGTVTDIDGNSYKTVRIGAQWWMAENLKVTRYRNLDAMPNVIDGAAWVGLSTGAYCNYNNDVNNVALYGRLYNWFAVIDGRMIAPVGWHVASDAEWQTLIDYLGGVAVAGGKMKEVGTTNCTSPNTGATNESGFSALPGGYSNGAYNNMGVNANFWSSTEDTNNYAWFRDLYCEATRVNRGFNGKNFGFSVRCVKD